MNEPTDGRGVNVLRGAEGPAALLTGEIQGEDQKGEGRALVRRRTVAEIIAESHEHTREVFELAEHLARALNNDRIRTAHFLLALTLTPHGIQILDAEKVQRTAIRTNCWKRIRPTDRPANEKLAATISENLGMLLARADAHARNRSRQLLIEDILDMLRSDELREHYDEYLSLENSPEPAIETLAVLKELKGALRAVVAAQPRLGPEALTTIPESRLFEYGARLVVAGTTTLSDKQDAFATELKTLASELRKAQKTINRTHTLGWVSIATLSVAMCVSLFLLGLHYR